MKDKGAKGGLEVAHGNERNWLPDWAVSNSRG